MKSKYTGALVVALLAVPRPALAQEEDIYFGGATLDQLCTAVIELAQGQGGYVPIKNQQLREELLRSPKATPLLLLIVPKDSGPANPLVRKYYSKRNEFQLTNKVVEADDVAALREFSKSPVVSALRAALADDKPDPVAVARLVEIVKKEPASRVFVGGELAARRTIPPELQPFVAEYKKLVTKRGEAIDVDDLEVGKPYVFGPGVVTASQLAGLRYSDDIRDVKIGGVEFKQAWIGSTAVYVKPSKTTGLVTDGLDKLQLDIGTADQIRNWNKNPELKLDRLPVSPKK